MDRSDQEVRNRKTSVDREATTPNQFSSALLKQTEYPTALKYVTMLPVY